MESVRSSDPKTENGAAPTEPDNQWEFGFDPASDPELALALKLSMEDEEDRQRQAAGLPAIQRAGTPPKKPDSEERAPPRLKRKTTIIFRPQKTEVDPQTVQDLVDRFRTEMQKNLESSSTDKKRASQVETHHKSADGGQKRAREEDVQFQAKINSMYKAAVHFFDYVKRNSLREPGPRQGEIIILGFNDFATSRDLSNDRQPTTYHVPRLFTPPATEFVSGHPAANPLDVSGYIQQIKNRRNANANDDKTGRSTDIAKPDPTLGYTVLRDGVREEFTLGADDLVVLAPQAEEEPHDLFEQAQVPVPNHRRPPWGQTDVYPFAHEGHFGRTKLKHFAWEYTAKVRCDRPPAAAEGVHFWLIDYRLRRAEEYKVRTAVEGHRFVFYGKGVRFVEVRKEDSEWAGGRDTAGALTLCKYWRQHMRWESILDEPKRFYTWNPNFGALACEVGEFGDEGEGGGERMEGVEKCA